MDMIMKKNLIAVCMAAVLAFSMTACGNAASTDKVENPEKSVSMDVQGEEDSERTDSGEDLIDGEEQIEESDSAEVTEGTDPAAVSSKTIPEGIYVIGDYIKPGTYVFANNTETDYLGVVMFNSAESYDAYNESERFTVGEESAAVEKNAWYNEFLNSGESVYMNLREGSVLVVKDAELTMNPVTVGDYVGAEDAVPFSSALLTIGTELPEGQYVFDCTELAGYSTELLLFESVDTYRAYHTTKRFTNGEEREAVEANAKASEWLQTGKSFSTYLSEGNILIIDGGFVKISKLE